MRLLRNPTACLPDKRKHLVRRRGQTRLAKLTTPRATALPASALAKTAHYTLALWPKLTRFLEYPELELSNNLAENSMRPVALGRKNWIHISRIRGFPS